MGKPVSLFSGYGQKENRTTNYCLLMFKLIYEENSKYLSEVISQLIGESTGSNIGVDFLQQKRKGNSVPDGIIIQKSFVLYIETKLHKGFKTQQILNHLDALHNENSEEKVLLAIGDFDIDQKQRLSEIRENVKTKYEDKLIFAPISFEELLEAFKIANLSKSLRDSLDDFQQYLDEQDLLPNWKMQLDVVNCVGLPEDILNHNVYMCPAESGAYSHKRSKYFGMYREKNVEKIALIEAVLDVTDDCNAELLWKNVDKDNNELTTKAIFKVKSLRNEFPTRVFILGELYDTKFIKDTKGGLMGSKLYFDVSEENPEDEKDLSEKLNGKYWKDLK